MNRGSPEARELQALAGEYVLGTLGAAERRRVEARLPTDPELAAAVRAWEERLLPLTALAEPVSPPDRLWQRVERSLGALAGFPAAMPLSRRPWWRDWNSLTLWRGLAASGFAAAAVLAAVLVGRLAEPLPATRFMVVLVAPEDRAPGWVVQTRTSGQIELVPLGVVEVPADKALQFWTKADSWSAPVSLGLVTPGQSAKVPVSGLPALQPNQLFELTLEPRTGSPTGRPTGPVRFIGRAVQVL
ncbi:anti-sigma factor [Zoogloea sp.]|uniref:anti-sigma factor n=1 Tax=Zoogloea sp. TaxID=49181 RepID=UPI002626DD50|nr:anti-sigma factor [Zoogloea sp.]MDD3354993.1 anti-sigma factor [Zoogloea sp.]